MPKGTMTETVALIPVSESTLRRDIKSGKVSYTTDAKGRKQLDVAELERVYGALTETEPAVKTCQPSPTVNGDDTPENPPTLLFLTETDTAAKMVSLLERVFGLIMISPHFQNASP